MVSSMLVRGVDHLQCHHVDHHVSWSKFMGLVGWLVWLVKTNCWVSPERRFLTSPTHPPPLHKCRGQSHKSRPELFYPFYNHSWTLPLASYILLLRFQDFFHLTKSLVIFFNHPRRPVLVVTVLAVCTDGPALCTLRCALCTLHATVAWMLDATPPLGLRTSEKRGNGRKDARTAYFVTPLQPQETFPLLKLTQWSWLKLRENLREQRKHIEPSYFLIPRL